MMKFFLFISLLLVNFVSVFTDAQLVDQEFKMLSITIIDVFDDHENLGNLNKTAIDDWLINDVQLFTQDELDEKFEQFVDYIWETYGIPLTANTNPSAPQAAEYIVNGVPIALAFRYNVSECVRPRHFEIDSDSLKDWAVRKFRQYDIGWTVALLQDWNDTTNTGVFVPAGQSIIYGSYEFINDAHPLLFTLGILPNEIKRFTIELHSRQRVIVDKLEKSLANGNWIGVGTTSSFGLQNMTCSIMGSLDDVIFVEGKGYHKRLQHSIRCPSGDDV